MLAIDIETSYCDLELPPHEQEKLNASAAQKGVDEKDLRSVSPATGVVVCVGAADLVSGDGVIFFNYQNDCETVLSDRDVVKDLDTTIDVDGVDFKVKFGTERQVLQEFYALASEHLKFVTFYGRNFDFPFLAFRAMVNRVKLTTNLDTNRYSYQKHIDLADVLGFRGAASFPKMSMDAVCNALGVISPKAHGIMAKDVPALWRSHPVNGGLGEARKSFLDIATYNARDVIATGHVYGRVLESMDRAIPELNPV